MGDKELQILFRERAILQECLASTRFYLFTIEHKNLYLQKNQKENDKRPLQSRIVKLLFFYSDIGSGKGNRRQGGRQIKSKRRFYFILSYRWRIFAGSLVYPYLRKCCFKDFVMIFSSSSSMFSKVSPKMSEESVMERSVERSGVF